MTERELTAALDALVDPCEGAHGDWQDVLGRAGVAARDPQRRPSRARRVGVVAFAALALVVVAVVSTGFGRDALSSLLGRIHVDFWSSDPAPQPARWWFEDLAIGSPPRVAPQAIVSQARTVGTLHIRGKERTLWVVPTRRGGFCYMAEKSFGGCQNRPSPNGPRIAASPGVSIGPRAADARIFAVQGMVYSDEIERLTIEFANGESEDIDFVYVSAPIDAGFFHYTAPGERQRGDARVSAVVARDGSGEVVARQDIPFPRFRLPRVPPLTSIPREPRTRPARPLPQPSAPVQRGEANGVSITAGSNGSVLFDLSGITPERRALLADGVTFVCFELVVRGGVQQDRALGYPGDLQPTVGFRYHGIGTPLDGCYLYGRYGHRWPDKLGSHDVIEVAFTEDGRRFFDDRAAASDLALFARSRAMHRLRQKTPITADELRVEFGTRIAALASRAATPPRGMIGYWVDGPNLVLRRVTASGRRLEIVIGPDGGITSENIRHLTRVE